MVEKIPGYRDLDDVPEEGPQPDRDSTTGDGRTLIRDAIAQARSSSNDGEDFKARVIAAAEAEECEATTLDESLADFDEAEADEQKPPAKPNDRGFKVEDINREFALVLIGSRAVVVKQSSDGPIDDRQRILTREAFVSWFENQFTEFRNAKGEIKTTSWGLRWLTSKGRRQYEGIEFYPDPNNTPGAPGRLNLWRGFAYEPKAKANGYKTFADHLKNNICGGDEKLFSWVFGFFAHMVQRPRERIGVALVLRGGMGTGKTIVGESVGALFPAHYFLVDDPRYVTANFNAHMASCLLLQADEAVWAGDKAAEGRLKGLITSPIQQIEHKGVDPIRLKNYVRLFMTSNEQWVVPAGPDERRFAVIEVDPRCATNHAYFAEMVAELQDGGYEALLHDLIAFDLSKVDMRTIPKTRALLDQKEQSLGPLKRWWLDCLDGGTNTSGSEEWVCAVSKKLLYASYAESVGRNKGAFVQSRSQFFKDLKKLVPGLRPKRPGGDDRDREIILPTLRDCRDEWDRQMQQARNWDPDNERYEPREREDGGEF